MARGFGWSFIFHLLCACSSESHSDSKNTVAGTTATNDNLGGSSTSSGGASGTSNPSSGGVGYTGGSSTGPVVHNGGRPATTWTPTACGGSSTLGSVDPTQLNYAVAQSPRQFLLINVHVPVSGHIPSTDVDIAYTDVTAIEQFIGDDKSQPAILYCMTNAMSTVAGTQIVADGYCNISIVTGGLKAWRDAGYATD